jgi:ZIP family zinc transporter
MSRGHILGTITVLGALVFLTAVAGATVLSRLPAGAMEVVLSFSAAALLYLVTEELLREA